MVIGKGLILTLIGVALGVTGSFFVTRLMSGMLFQVKASDPAVYVMVAILLAVVALVASYIPARRAARIDPLIAIRQE